MPRTAGRGASTHRSPEGALSTIDETRSTPRTPRRPESRLPHHRVEFPPPSRDRTPDQDEASFFLVEDGQREPIRFHEYGEIYRRPGLYEQLFYDRPKCQSPRKVTEILHATLQKNEAHHSQLRVMDLGAGNGMAGEAVAEYGVARLVGVDIVPEARDAAFRDRPGLYDHYYVCDMGDLEEDERDELEAWSFDCLLTVAALGFGDIPAAVLTQGFELVSDNAWIAFNIQESFLDVTDESGFSKLVRELVFSDYMQLHHMERYRHRLAIDGRPLYYYAVVARKTGRPLPRVV
ncbi:MAG: class I SAM-dependent DNA methyltransferase [Candidatus Longimicrobiales bacterium M2_2A_002]